MTMTSPKATGQSAARASTKAAEIDWTSVQSGLWVGNSNGEFAGMIEALRGEGFRATTRLGKQLGVFKTMEVARASFLY